MCHSIWQKPASSYLASWGGASAPSTLASATSESGTDSRTSESDTFVSDSLTSNISASGSSGSPGRWFVGMCYLLESGPSRFVVSTFRVSAVSLSTYHASVSGTVLLALAHFLGLGLGWIDIHPLSGRFAGVCHLGMQGLKLLANAPNERNIITIYKYKLVFNNMFGSCGDIVILDHR